MAFKGHKPVWFRVWVGSYDGPVDPLHMGSLYWYSRLSPDELDSCLMPLLVHHDRVVVVCVDAHGLTIHFDSKVGFLPEVDAATTRLLHLAELADSAKEALDVLAPQPENTDH